MTRRIEKEKIKAIKIVLSGSESEPINLLNQVLIGLRTPAGFPTSVLTLKESPKLLDDYRIVYNGNGDYGTIGDLSFDVEGDKSLYFLPYTVAGINFLKLNFDVGVGGQIVEILTREID